MKLCRWLGNRWLGAFFYRALGHHWQFERFVGPYIENRCARCGAWRHADTYEGAIGIRDAYRWNEGRAPTVRSKP